MISSNGGTWSNIKSEFNNVVKTFKFSKGDVIVCDVDLLSKKIQFMKKSTKETYCLDFEIKHNDPLHPCVLFYYINDEIEFINQGDLECKK